MNNNIENIEDAEDTGFLTRMQYLRQDEQVTIGFIARMSYRDIQELGGWLKDHEIKPIYQTFAKGSEFLKIVKISGGDINE